MHIAYFPTHPSLNLRAREGYPPCKQLCNKVQELREELKEVKPVELDKELTIDGYLYREYTYRILQTIDDPFHPWYHFFLYHSAVKHVCSCTSSGIGSSKEFCFGHGGTAEEPTRVQPCPFRCDLGPSVFP